MAEQVTAGAPVVAMPAGNAPVEAGIQYQFPVEVEVRTTLAAADVDAAVHKSLMALASAVRSA